MIISVAILLATLIYVVIAFFLAQSNEWPLIWQLLPEYKMLLWVFAGLAFVMGGAALVLSGLPRIVRIAIAEGVALLGFVLVFLHHSPLWMLPFAGFSILLQVLLSPLVSQDRAKDCLE